MKKLFSLALVLAMLLSCAALAEAPITLTYAEVNPIEGTIVGAIATAFKDKVEELTGGSVLIDIQASGVLGSEDQILDNLLAGGNVTDISRISAFALTQYGCEKATLLNIPYTFVNEDHFWAFAASDLAREFLMEPQEIGLPLRGICYGEEGFRHFFFKNEVKGIEDLKGLKIRVSSDPVSTGYVGNLGAAATTVPFTELYTSLQSGVVDAAEQPVSNYLSNAFPEVAPYLLQDGHTLGAVQIVITDNAWAKLSEDQQNAILAAGEYASAVCKEKVAEIEGQTYEKLAEMGVTVVPVEDKTPWVEACQPTIQEYTKAQADVYQQILDLAK